MGQNFNLSAPPHSPFISLHCYVNSMYISFMFNYHISWVYIYIFGYPYNMECQCYYLKISRRPSRAVPNTGWKWFKGICRWKQGLCTCQGMDTLHSHCQQNYLIVFEIHLDFSHLPVLAHANPSALNSHSPPCQLSVLLWT